jgi:hypothetical protein
MPRHPDGIPSSTLKALYEASELDIAKDTPGIVCAAVSIRTSDDYLIVAQRALRAQAAQGVSPLTDVSYEPGAYSPSAEETMDPSEEWHPHQTAIRCAREEFAIDERWSEEEKGERVRLLAVGREWGGANCWNTNLIYALRVKASSHHVLDPETRRKAKSRHEHTGVCAVPIRTPEERRAFLKLLAENRINGNDFRNVGFLKPDAFHRSSAIARVLLSFTHWFGDPRSLVE